jgi:hypothetical protein
MVAATLRPIVQYHIYDRTHVDLGSILTGWFIKQTNVQLLNRIAAKIDAVKTQQATLFASKVGWYPRFRATSSALPSYECPHQPEPPVPRKKLHI